MLTPYLNTHLTLSFPSQRNNNPTTPTRKAPPITALSMSTSPISIMSSPATSPQSFPELTNILDTRPQPRLEHHPVLLTCPHCTYTYTTTSPRPCLTCTRCLRRFKRDQHRERRNTAHLTVFPRLLEEHAIVRGSEREEERKDERLVGSFERMWDAVWGGGGRSRHRSGSRSRSGSESGNEGEETGNGDWGTSMGVFGLGSTWMK